MRLRYLPILALLSLLCTCGPAQISAQIDLDHWAALSPRNIGPAGMSGRVTAIDVNPTDRDHIYVGTASGGVWMSRNGGISFEPIFDDQKYLGIGSVAVSDANPNVIWVGTGEGNPRNSANYGGGIYKSLDGGKTWKHMGLEATRHIHRVIVHPTNPDIVYAGAMGNMWYPNEERGVFRTMDGGKTWKKVLYVDDGTGIADMIIDPNNPNKIIAATWTFDRDPDYFNSGGPGSGIWITHDGGDNWERKTAKHGLPKGDLGRIGLAIATNKSNILYALVEAKVNGLYKSTDGGANWKLVSTKDIGNRPFYYAELYVDPQNENRIYNVYTYISKSEDGGKSFREIADYGNNVHPDHHAFWIDPNDPEYVIDGNDGGLNISHDGGETWRFAANLPLAQLYHINYDMSFPYLVGGGMQDNGSWVGPSQGLKSGGITDSDWQEVYFGDGFDLIFKPGSKNMVYAASQGGSLGRVNRTTGKTVGIKPVHPDGTFLRFNWNAPIAQSDEGDCTIYMGSQFVHKSTDCGDNWTIISPDLTTNDSLRQRSMISGGLTIDATQAENHTTLLVIEPNHNGFNEKQGLWVGSDDGRLHFSPDDGKTWNDLTGTLEAAGMTNGSYIPYIHASLHDPAAAWVIVNDFRRGDTKPYVYYTTDYGETFLELIDNSPYYADASNEELTLGSEPVTGHTLAIVQDPVEPSLLFLGTDQGLWISFDSGLTWVRHDAGYPHVSTRDMKIHPREHDLIIGTFGRAVWILDDIRPLREIASTGAQAVRDSFTLFPAPDAYQWSRRSYQGTRFYAQGQFQGEDRMRGAMLTYWVLPQEEKGGKGKGKKGMESSPTSASSPLSREEGPGERAKRKKGKKNTGAVPDRVRGRMRAGAVEPVKEQGEDVSRLLRYSVAEDPAEAELLTAADKDPNPQAPNKKKMKIQVVDTQSGDTIRTYKTTPRYGMNRTSWNMRRDGISFPSRRAARPDADAPSGAEVPPGVYEVVMTFGNHVGKTMVTVHADPREDKATGNPLAAREALGAEYDTTVVRLTEAWDDLQMAGKSLTRIEGLLKDAPKEVKDSLTADIKDLKKAIAEIEEVYTEKEGLKGIQRNPTNLQAKMFTARRYIGQVEGKASQMATVTLEQFQAGTVDFIDKVNAFMRDEFAPFREEVEGAELSLFGKL